MYPSNHTKGFVLAFISAFLYGLIPVFAKTLTSLFPALFVAFLITSISAFYFAIVAVGKHAFFEYIFSKKLPWVIGIGFFAALGSILSFIGVSLGKASEAGFFFQFQTFFATILAYFFLKEKLTRFQVIGLFSMFLGAYIFATNVSLSFQLSTILFLGAAFAWGLNTVIVRKKTKDISQYFLAFGRSFFSLFFLLPFSLQYFFVHMPKVFDGYIFHFLIYGGIVAGMILALYSSLRHIKAAEATSFQLIIPIISAITSFFVLGERLTFAQIIGGGVILAGLFLVHMFPYRQGSKNASVA